MKKLLRSYANYQFTPVILAFLVLLSYALFIPSMGYFMDDWYLIWFKHIFGASQYPAYFSVDRPLMGYFYVAANYLLGNSESALVWQLFGVITRWLCVYALWGFLNTLWPDAKRQNTLVVLLAAVFPGFTQQWIAIIYSFFFTCLAGFFLSLTLMLKAVRTPNRFWFYMIFSLLTGVYSYAAAEFYFGLELIRPVVLWIEYSRSLPAFKARLLKTIKSYWIYFVAFLSYAIWRTFFFVSVNHGVMVNEKLKNSPFLVVAELLKKIYQAGVDSTVNAWFNPLNLENYPTHGIIPLVILAVVFVTFILISIWLFQISKEDLPNRADHENSWNKEAFWLSLAALVVSVIPFWGADLPIDYVYPYDRFLLAYLFGSCLMIVVFLNNRKTGMFLIALLIAVSTGFQMNTAIRYKNQWIQQSDFFWQLTWRAPSIEENTVLITEDLPFSKVYSGPSLTAPLNLTYAPDLKTKEIPYLFVIRSQQKDVIKKYLPNMPVEYDFRSFIFSGNTSAMLVLKKPADGCLQIVAPTDLPDAYAKKDDIDFWQESIPFSNLNLIADNPDSQAVPPDRFFGNENRNQWCYYFEKADLARQQKNWEQTIKLYNDAENLGFTPQIDSEWVPLLDAYIQIGELDKAQELTKKITNHIHANTVGLCQLWKDAEAEGSGSGQASESIDWLECNKLQ